MTMEEARKVMEVWDKEHQNDGEELGDEGAESTSIYRPGFESSARQMAAEQDDGKIEEDDCECEHEEFEHHKKAWYNLDEDEFIKEYIDLYSEPSDTTPSGQPRQNHPDEASLALYTPLELGIALGHLGADRAEAEKNMRLLYGQLRRQDISNEDFQTAERELFEVCYSLNCKIEARTKELAVLRRQMELNVESVSYPSNIPNSLSSAFSDFRTHKKATAMVREVSGHLDEKDIMAACEGMRSRISPTEIAEMLAEIQAQDFCDGEKQDSTHHGTMEDGNTQAKSSAKRKLSKKTYGCRVS